MDGIIILQAVILLVVLFALRAMYLKGRYDERREDIRPRQKTFDPGSQLEQGIRSCREANELHGQVERMRGETDS